MSNAMVLFVCQCVGPELSQHLAKIGPTCLRQRLASVGHILTNPMTIASGSVIAGLMSGKFRKSCLSEKVLSCPKVAEVKKIFWAAPAIKYALLHLSSHMTMSVICLNDFSTFPQIMPSRGNVSDGDGITCLLYILK